MSLELKIVLGLLAFSVAGAGTLYVAKKAAAATPKLPGVTPYAPTDVVQDPVAIELANAGLTTLAFPLGFTAPPVKSGPSNPAFVAAVKKLQLAEPALRQDGVLDWETWSAIVFAAAVANKVAPSTGTITDPRLIALAQVALLKQKVKVPTFTVDGNASNGTFVTGLVIFQNAANKQAGVPAVNTAGTVDYATVAVLLVAAYLSP